MFLLEKRQTGVPQGSVLGPLFFLINKNDLPRDLYFDVKLLTNDTSLFSVTDYISASPTLLYKDLINNRDWAYKWKMSFNHDRAKQAQETIFLRKTKRFSHSSLQFNNPEKQ